MLSLEGGLEEESRGDMDVVREDVKGVGLREEEAEGRVRWRQMIC